MTKLRLSHAVSALLALAPIAPALAQENAEIGRWGVDITGISKSVRPGDDFWTYVNEGWLKQTKIPAGLPSYNDMFRLYLSNEERVQGLINGLLAQRHAPGSPEQQIVDYYRSVSDRARVDELGLTPIAQYLARIAAAHSHNDLARISAMPGMAGLIAAGVLADAGEPQHYIPVVAQGDLTLPATDYYTRDGEPYATLRAALRGYAAATLKRAGIADAEAKADRILALEIEIAKRHWTTAQQRDAVKRYHPMPAAALPTFAPGFPWRIFLAQWGGIEKAPKLSVATDSSVQALARLYGETPLDAWKDYMTFRLIDQWADDLGGEWQAAAFDLHQRKLMGIQQPRPLLQRAIAATNAAMGQQIGRLYVARWFPASDRAAVDEIIDHVRASFKERIGALPWMDDATRAQAEQKLEKVVRHIGYPDRWQDRSGIVIKADDLVGNNMQILAWQRSDSLHQLKEKRRDWQWPYPPQEVNAGYMAPTNAITFPAGILQAPFFDPHADIAVNFGSIAAVIGHEFGHGFDDQGSRSDGDGRLRDWWTAGSRAEFDKRTGGLVEQFDQYEPVPGTHINGRQNLGENIGDLGGLSIAYAAYRRYVAEKQGGEAPVVDGLTGDQRFFLAWAQLWRELATPDQLRQQALSDNHSAGKFRVNGVVRNMDSWYAAFDIRPGDALYLAPEKRVRIW